MFGIIKTNYFLSSSTGAAYFYYKNICNIVSKSKRVIICSYHIFKDTIMIKKVKNVKTVCDD